MKHIARSAVPRSFSSAPVPRLAASVLGLVGALLAPGTVAAQGEPAAPSTPSAPAEAPAAGGQITILPMPSGPSTSPTTSAAPDVNAHLPSSARVSTDTSRASDGFDFGPTGTGGGSIRGSEKGAYIVSGQYVPDTHTAKRGDTLWEIASSYYGNPYQWPRIWAQNKQIQNPHWIYPGDTIRLRTDPGVRQTYFGLNRPQRVSTPDTVFLRNVGFVQDGKDPVWGEVVGSPDDQMLLTAHDPVYIQLDDDHAAAVGDKLTVIESIDVDNLADAEFVYIRGVVEVNRYNPKTHMVRGEIIEAFDPIERGAMVVPVDRVIDVVKPTSNRVGLSARIIGSLYPHAFYGQHQVVFVDKGTKDGIDVGNRFLAVAKGDEWRHNLKNAGGMADLRAMTEDDRDVRVEQTPDHGDEDRYPTETIGELLVVRVREETATCLVTAAIRELSRGQAVVAREGY